MVEPKPVQGRTSTRVEDRASLWNRQVPGVALDPVPPDYRARMTSRRASMRAHPSAQSRVIGRPER